MEDWKEKFKEEIQPSWEKLLIEQGFVDIVDLETEIGKLTFRIVSITEEGFIGNIDEKNSNLADRYKEVKAALEELDQQQQHSIYVMVERNTGKISLKIGKRAPKSIDQNEH